MRAIRIAAMVAVLTGASAVFTSTAQAEALNGTYAVDGGNALQPGLTWTFTPCGPDCVTLRGSAGSIGDLQRQGATWAGVVSGCQTTVEENSLTGSLSCPMLPSVPVTLSRA